MDAPRPPDHLPDEPARDAWLSEALRHAPDADAAPSAAVRETILRQARTEAAGASRPAGRIGAWQRFKATWSWLSGPRVAAGFASVTVATVVGLMWWDRPLDEALRPAEPPATVAAPAAEDAPSSTAPAAPVTRREAPSRELTGVAPSRAAQERKREARAHADAAKDTRRETPPAPAAQAAKRAPDETRALADAPADAPATARADKEGASSGAEVERQADTAESKAPAPALRSAPAAAAGTVAPAGQGSRSTTGAESTQRRTALPAAPLRALLEALSNEPARWRSQHDGGRERPLTPQLQAWLQGLDRAVAGRWSGVDSTAPPTGQEVRLLRDGNVQAIVRLGTDGGVRIDIAGEAPLVAHLAAPEAAALRSRLDDATR